MKGLQALPGSIDSIIFCIPMPQSWSKKKREQMEGQPHQQTPDLDNLCKGVLDALCAEDKHIHFIGTLKKVWSEAGSIEMTLPDIPDEVQEYAGSSIYKHLW